MIARISICAISGEVAVITLFFFFFYIGHSMITQGFIKKHANLLQCQCHLRLLSCLIRFRRYWVLMVRSLNGQCPSCVQWDYFHRRWKIKSAAHITNLYGRNMYRLTPTSIVFTSVPFDTVTSNSCQNLVCSDSKIHSIQDIFYTHFLDEEVLFKQLQLRHVGVIFGCVLGTTGE